jgi:hypothetical protein
MRRRRQKTGDRVRVGRGAGSSEMDIKNEARGKRECEREENEQLL